MSDPVPSQRWFNENYDGPDEAVAKAQFEGDGWLSEIARLRAAPPFRLPLEDRTEIVELTNLWDSAYDALDRELWLSCLTEDFVFASRGFGDFAGRAAMAGYYDSYKQVFHGLRHVISNNIVVGDAPDRARGFCYLTVFERIHGTDMLGTSPFMDHYEKHDGRWLFSRRDQVVDPGMTMTAAGQKLMAAFAALMKKEA